MFGITDIWAYLLGTALIIILPGPNSLYCLSVSSSNKTSGVFSMLGILLGDSLLMLATVLGAGTLLKMYPVIFSAIKLIGGAYLAYLGIRLLLGARLVFLYRHQPKTAQKRATIPTLPKVAFYKALSLSLTNPKAILFLLSFFVQFVRPDYAYPFLSFLILAVILQIMSASYLGLLVVAGERLSERFSSNNTLVIIAMAVIGFLFISFAVNLWLANL